MRQLGAEGLGGEEAHPGGGELEGQGQSVQAPADLGHGGGVPGREVESGPHLPGPGDEQAHGVCLSHFLRQIGAPGQGPLGNAEGEHQEALLTGQLEGDPAGGGDRQVWAGREESGHLGRRRREQVLHVVQHQQPGGALEAGVQTLAEGQPRPVRLHHAQGPRGGGAGRAPAR